ncbi:gamma carbonic anhydrase family protein [Desulfurispora thermophila]|uniref:gamma carbonic anhydrase family protein n=1 Tax=Desulfurispora thermophila TaxID=265470 RepID=UPI00038094B4|nr:gamma carbonic anhydrase family protein [Desulfurispora thermophila]
MPLIPYGDKTPQIGANVFIAPTATLIGNVVVEEGASIWFGAVLRGDFGQIRVGRQSSIQDNVVVHVLPGGETLIGDNVTVAHGAVLHNCKIGDGAVIGMNAVVLDHAVVGEKAMLAAGSVVSTGGQIPPRHLAAGAPAVPKKEISGEALNWVEQSALAYTYLAKSYMDAGIDRLDK